MSHRDHFLRAHGFIQEVDVAVRPIVKLVLDAKLLENMGHRKSVLVVLPLREELVKVRTGLRH